MPEVGDGAGRAEGGDRYVGERSRRWPEGRPLCGAKKRREEGFCTWTAGQGTDHLGRGSCERHGGNLPSHKIAAERAQIADLAGRYSVPRTVHPLEGVLEQYHRYAGQVAWLEQRVNELPEESLFWGVESEVDRRSPDGEDGEDGVPLRTGSAAEFERKSKAGPNALLEQFDRVQAQYAKLGVEIVRIGLETARDALASKFATNLQRVLDELMAECAALAAETPDPGRLPELFRARMVAKIAVLAGAQPKQIDGVAA
ncbi:hypothetical protein Drose_06360 [Dactylosporangium roseum]|uniref:Uncharacterized protein n=1 Tax=Dactylosporangium roseum TaxID=47989 RepID=A0ABY5Z765_9ACTN|nr:hypothetical protein [Dactylosporangium roseum]UWZ37895.1 hypothetical protein Drose_06360 [Dactylosporangium roseum]